MTRIKTRRSKTISFFVRLLVVLTVLFSLVFSGYMVLDKAIIPKYLGQFGIHNFKDLVGMVKMLYTTPQEKAFITHPFTAADETSAINKLENAKVPVVNGQINFNSIIDDGVVIDPIIKENGIYLTDSELAAIFDQMLQSGVLSTYLEDLSYIDTLSIHAKELTITPKNPVDEITGSPAKHSNSAHISLTVKVETANAQKHMAKEMNVPPFLLNLIMPDVLYVTTTYDVSIDAEGNYSSSNSTIAVNGRSPKQSQILLNLLVKFIFPKEDKMTVEKFGETFGNIVNRGLKILGDVKFTSQQKNGSIPESAGITVCLSFEELKTKIEGFKFDSVIVENENIENQLKLIIQITNTNAIDSSFDFSRIKLKRNDIIISESISIGVELLTAGETKQFTMFSTLVESTEIVEGDSIEVFVGDKKVKAVLVLTV